MSTEQGSAALIGAAISWVLENVTPIRDWLGGLGCWSIGKFSIPKARALLLLAFVGLPVAVAALACAGVDVRLGGVCPADAQGYIELAISGAYAFGGSQLWHVVNKQL